QTVRGGHDGVPAGARNRVEPAGVLNTRAVPSAEASRRALRGVPWSAPAGRSDDGALALGPSFDTRAKAVSRFTCHGIPHSRTAIRKPSRFPRNSPYFFLALLLPLLAGCGTMGYYAQAIHGQCQILHRKKPIQELLADTNTPPELK